MNRFLAKLGSLIEIQVLIFFAAFPVLSAWGMSSSLWSIVGNCLFFPCIVIFLFCSIIFLLVLPIPLLASGMGSVMSVIVAIWRWCLDCTLGEGLYAVPWHGYVFGATLFCCFLGALHIQHGSRWQRVVCLALVYGAFFYGGQVFLASKKEQLWCSGASLSIYMRQGAVWAIDTGQRRQTRHLDSWAQYRVPELLARSWGRLYIDVYKVVRLTDSVKKTVSALCKRRLIKTVYICRNQKAQEKAHLSELCAYAEQAGATVFIE